MKKVGKTTIPFRYDLNQIPYTVEVRNRFKGLDLIDRVLMNYEWTFATLYRREGSRPSPRIRNAKRHSYLRRPYKYLRKQEKLKVKEKRKDIPFECRVPKKSKER